MNGLLPGLPMQFRPKLLELGRLGSPLQGGMFLEGLGDPPLLGEVPGLFQGFDPLLEPLNLGCILREGLGKGFRIPPAPAPAQADGTRDEGGET